MLTACADKQECTDAILAEMKKDKDLQDYKIDPEQMTKCVVDLSSQKMPGIFPLDPVRLTSYQNYTKMLSMNTAENADKKVLLEELRAAFGSPKALGDAHSNYTESMMDCMASVLVKSENTEKEKSISEEDLGTENIELNNEKPNDS